jgi:hypothetical protein
VHPEVEDVGVRLVVELLHQCTPVYLLVLSVALVLLAVS